VSRWRSGFGTTGTTANPAGSGPPRAGGVRLLPAFDKYVVAPRYAGGFLDGISPDRVHRPQGWSSPVPLVNGKFAGVRRFERKGERTAVAVEPFFPVSAPTRKTVRAEIDRFAEFRGSSTTVEWLD